MTRKMVQLQRVGKRYGDSKYILQNVSFDLEPGEFAYVTGPSGAGKTTLLKLLFAAERPSEGYVLVNDRDLGVLPRSHLHQFRRSVGFVFQDFKLLPDLTIYENVSLPLDVQNLPEHKVDYRVRGVLSLVGLADRADDYPSTLSGGEQQRIAIARAIVTKPSLLLADEPTGNLDTKTAKEIMSLFQEIREMGTTVLVATHDEMLMEAFPGRMIELEKGLMIADREYTT